MIRAPILSAVAAALLLGFAASIPAAAADAQSSPAPAVTPAPSAPAKGEFDNSCAMGLAEGQTLKTDCSVNWTAPDGKVYCFSSENSKATFLKNAEANIKKAQDFRASKAAAAASGKTKNFTEEDVNAAVKTAIDGRSMLVCRPVNADVNRMSSALLVTSNALYLGSAMLSRVAMNFVPI